MGVRFVVIVENLAGKLQEEVNEYFPVHKFSDDTVFPEWEIFTYEGKSYASWAIGRPRYFFPEEHPKKWEALRKYLVRVREFFGGGNMFLGNDAVWYADYEDERNFYLPPKVSEEDLREPDYEKHPELKDIKELYGLTW